MQVLPKCYHCALGPLTWNTNVLESFEVHEGDLSKSHIKGIWARTDYKRKRQTVSIKGSIVDSTCSKLVIQSSSLLSGRDEEQLLVLWRMRSNDEDTAPHVSIKGLQML